MVAASILAWGLTLSYGAHRADAQAAASPAGGIVLRDDLGREVKFDRYPERIVSLLPSLTETVCELGACDRLVATDRYSNWPAQVQALPKTGGLDDAEVEQIVRLHPDIVLLSRSQRITDRLHELGLESFALDTQSYAAVSRVITVIGALLGLDHRAFSLNRRIEEAVRRLSAQELARRHGAGPSVYFEVDGAAFAAGPDSFIGEILTLLGARNIVTADLGPFPRINPEYVVRHNPDVIFIPEAEASQLAQRPGWDRIRAIREHRLCSFPLAVRDTIVRPGPRVAEGMRAVADCLDRVSP